MASLLYPDEDRSQWPTSLLPVDDGTPPVLQADPRADALGQTYRDVSDYLARQQAKSEAEGYWTGGGLLEGGHPTGKGLLDAIRQTGTAVALGTGAPGEKPPPGFTAYHGSPHSFDAFDLSKIGTGEGAQAYGHGMYLADAEGVARGYRDDITAMQSQRPVTINTGGPFGPVEILEHDPTKTGHMYEVQVNADPAHFLDWDTPMARQSDHVINALKQANGIAPEADLPASIANMTGQQLYEKLTKAVGGQHQASSILQDKYGIPGIRYLDAGSRGAGEGTSNSVVFDPATMEIIRKYGLAWLLGGGAAGASVMGGKQPEQ